ncbi:MAG: hypothetical protein MJ180_02245 [Candidatus Gastranaerophilales bacterium]|nr:hypothetical protein [Candidatus Gastranaerophilales bacterium]
MERFLTIGFLSKLALKKKNKDNEDEDIAVNEAKLAQAKEHLRSFIDKQ